MNRRELFKSIPLIAAIPVVVSTPETIGIPIVIDQVDELTPLRTFVKRLWEEGPGFVRTKLEHLMSADHRYNPYIIDVDKKGVFPDPLGSPHNIIRYKLNFVGPDGLEFGRMLEIYPIDIVGEVNINNRINLHIHRTADIMRNNIEQYYIPERREEGFEDSIGSWPKYPATFIDGATCFAPPTETRYGTVYV